MKKLNYKLGILLAIVLVSCQQTEKSENEGKVLQTVKNVEPELTNIEEKATSKNKNSLVVELQYFNLVFDDLSSQNEYLEISNDTVHISLDLTSYFKTGIIQILDIPERLDSLKIYENYKTTMSIQAEGPHLELYDWKEFKSDWKPLKLRNDQIYQMMEISEDGRAQFPKFTDEELLSELSKYENVNWRTYVSEMIEQGNRGFYWIGVSQRNLKVEYNIDGVKNQEIIKLWIPMGC